MGVLYKSCIQAVTQDAAQILPGLPQPGEAEINYMEEHHRFFTNTCFVLCFQSSTDLGAALCHLRSRRA